MAHYIRGEVLDIGAGAFDRYSDFFSTSRYVRLETLAGPDIDLVGSAESIPSGDKSFNSVVCTQVLEHVQHPERVVAEIARVLLPGGYCLITVPQSAELHEIPHDYFRYTRYGLESLFHEHGMVLVEAQRRGGFWVLSLHGLVRYLIERWKLYERKVAGRILSRFFQFGFAVAAWLDHRDHSLAGQHHTIGWAIVFQKP